MSKKIKKLKSKIFFLKEDVKYLKNQMSELEDAKRRRRKNEMKAMRVIITVAFLILSIASLYSVFIKE